MTPCEALFHDLFVGVTPDDVIGAELGILLKSGATVLGRMVSFLPNSIELKLTRRLGVIPRGKRLNILCDQIAGIAITKPKEEKTD